VEEAQTEKHLSEDLWLSTSSEPSRIVDRSSTVSSVEIGFQTKRRLISHLDTILEDSYREVL
jgi:hypothetical protein